MKADDFGLDRGLESIIFQHLSALSWLSLHDMVYALPTSKRSLCIKWRHANDTKNKFLFISIYSKRNWQMHFLLYSQAGTQDICM